MRKARHGISVAGRGYCSHPNGHLGSGVDAELGSQLLDVPFGGAFTDRELAPDLTVGQPIG
jgi:hypothetical protein